MTASYHIEHNDFGVVVRGEVPLDELLTLTKKWKKQGLTRMVLGVASALNASFAVTSPDKEQAWLDHVKESAKLHANGDPEREWLLGPDTGTSSLTIFYALTKRHADDEREVPLRDPSTPRDPDDFGRCRRLLKKFPEWRARMPEVADRYPEWRPLVRDWDKLDALYEEEVPNDKGKAPKLYEAMKACRAEVGP